LVTQSVFADHQIVITENSSTSLTATYDGSTSGVLVVNNGQNVWHVTFSRANFNSSTNRVGWVEPENPALLNDLFFGFAASNTVTVLSDGSFAFLVAQDESTKPFMGTDSTDGGSISVTFDDDGDVARTVPDTGSTFALLLLASVALLGATRVRSLQPP
jgi:hypothetical protein